MDTTKSWSEQQKAIFGWFEGGRGTNLVVRARSGTGKTTTILCGIDQAPESKILLCAFNKRIATELTQKLQNPRAEAKTLHAIGFSFIRRQWNSVRVDSDRGERLARQAAGQDAPDAMVRLVTNLASKAKGMAPFGTFEDLADIADQFDIAPDEEWEQDGWTVDRIVRLAAKAMDLAAKRDDGGASIDFDDMVFVPVRNRWVRGWWDMVVVDEAQDMNASQLLLARSACKAGGRIAVIGDDRQAIYGFRGADSGSIDRLKAELKAVELGLTITYRCPKTVVALAALLVPDYQAAAAAPEGLVNNAPYETGLLEANAGDFVLSRKNAPLASAALKLLRAGKRTKIEGKDIGAGLLSLVRKFKAKSIPNFLEKLTKWEEKEVRRAQASASKRKEEKVENIHDRAETLRYLAEGLSGPHELETRISDLFSDMEGHANGFIICSSVHRAKGLEADRVFLIEDSFKPRRGESSIEEDNIRYVAITRAKRELTWLMKPAPVAA